jgi:hypothetical protein
MRKPEKNKNPKEENICESFLKSNENEALLPESSPL